MRRTMLGILVGVVILFSTSGVMVGSNTLLSLEGDLELGNTAGSGGQYISIPVILNTRGVDTTGVHINFEYDAQLLGKPSLVRGPELPQEWYSPFSSPRDGEVRLVSIDLTGLSKHPINGQIAELIFQISEGSEVGSSGLITVTLADVLTGTGEKFNLIHPSGTISVTEPSEVQLDSILEDVLQRLSDLEERVGLLEGTVDPEPSPVLIGWFSDSLPSGAQPRPGVHSWIWENTDPTPIFGSTFHRSTLASGINQHYFLDATDTMEVGIGSVIYTHIYLDPESPPRQIMLQWNDGSWEHRAYWGENLIDWGVNDTNSRRRIGDIPPVGEWVKLEIPAGLVGLENGMVSGMAFALYDGSAAWDMTGVE